MSDERHWLEPPKWWKQFKPLRWIAFGVIGFIAVSTFYVADKILLPGEHDEARRFTEVAADPVAFFAGIRSYDTVASVKARLDAAKIAYKEQAQRPPRSSKYPPRDRDTLVAAKYVHLGDEGELTLEFFNDRLYEATFVPKTPATYAPKLPKADASFKPDRNGRAESTVGNRRVAANVQFATTDVGKSLQTKPYAVWQDLRLVAQLDEWDRRFVALPEAK